MSGLWIELSVHRPHFFDSSNERVIVICMGINAELGVGIAGDDVLAQDRPYTLALLRSAYGFRNSSEAEAALAVFQEAAAAAKRIRGAIVSAPQD